MVENARPAGAAVTAGATQASTSGIAHDTSVGSKDAPQSPPDAPIGSEGRWLPDSPSEGILERLGLHGVSEDDWWHEERRNACRGYLGTLLSWRVGEATRPTVRVEAHDLPWDMHKLLLADIRALWPWDDTIALLGRLGCGTAAARFGAEAVRTEVGNCLALGACWDKLDAAAGAVHLCRLRDERAKIIRHMLSVAHDADAVERDCQRLREVK